MKNQFIELGISSHIIKSLDSLGFTSPTDVQLNAIPKILEDQDLIVMAKTGSGKTGAFGIPIIEKLTGTDKTTETEGEEDKKKLKAPQALILTPTRELAIQVDSEIKKFSKHSQMKCVSVYGQHNIALEIEALEKGVSIVTGTPGRVFDHITKKTLITSGIKYLVLDEADRMLDMGFIDQVVGIIKTLPRNRVTLLFSATMPDEIKRICKTYMKSPEIIELDSDTMTVDSIEQVYHRVKPNEKRTQLHRILKANQPNSCMVFCNTRHEVDRVHEFLIGKGYVVDSLHGANSQSSRSRTIKAFKAGKLQILVATDVAARGLHIDDLTMVINYDVPVEKDSYVHRIGRTGRAGNGGKAATLVTSSDIMSLYEIEEHTGVLIDEAPLPSDEMVAEGMKLANPKWKEIKEANAQRQASRQSSRSSADSKPRNNHSRRNDKDDRALNSDRPKHGDKTKHSDKPRHAEKPKHGDAPRHGDKPKQTEKPRHSDNTRHSNRSRHSDKPRHTDNKHDKPRVYDKPRVHDKTSRPNTTDQVRPVPKAVETPTSTPNVESRPKSFFKKLIDRITGKK